MRQEIRQKWAWKSTPFPKKILRYGPATVVEWEDGSRTTVKPSPGTADDTYAAFCAALAIRISGSNSALKRMIDELTEIKEPGKSKHKTPVIITAEEDWSEGGADAGGDFTDAEVSLFRERYNAYLRYVGIPDGKSEKRIAFAEWGAICERMGDDARLRYREWLRYTREQA